MTKHRSIRGLVWPYLALAAVIALLAIPVLLFVRRSQQFSSSSDKLEQDVAEARAAGIPWVVSDFYHDPPLKDSENAAIEIYEIHRRFHAILGFEEAGPDLVDSISKLLDAGDFDGAMKKLKANEELIKLTESAAKKKDCDLRRDWDMGPYLMFPELSEGKKLVRLLGIRAKLKALDGDHAGAVSDLRYARRLGKFYGSDQVLIGLLVHIACDAITMRATQTCIALTSSQKDVKPYLDFLKGPEPDYDYRATLKGEAYWGVTIFRNMSQMGDLQELSSGGGGINERTIDPKTLKRDGLPTETMDRAYLATHLEIWTDIYNKSKSASSPDHFYKEVDEKVNEIVESKDLRYIYEMILLPTFSQMGDAILRGQATNRVQLAYTQIVDFRHKNGRNPKTLEEAGVNAVDPFSGNALGYVIKGKEFRVYSIGKNREDDGGRLKSEAASTQSKDYDEVAVYPDPIADQLKAAKLSGPKTSHPKRRITR